MVCDEHSLRGEPRGVFISQNETLAQATAQRLIAEQAGNAGSEADPAPAVLEALDAATVQLSLWLGPDGCRALLARALKRAAQQHNILDQVKVVADSGPMLAGIEETLARSDRREVAKALHATLVDLFDLLIRMVGADLTTKLAEQMLIADRRDTLRDDGEEAGT